MTAGEHLHQAGGRAARRRREVIVPDLDHPGALADREASQRDGVAGIELALGRGVPPLGIRYRQCKRSRAHDNRMTGEAI